jgi:hypothetical protein
LSATLVLLLFDEYLPDEEIDDESIVAAARERGNLDVVVEIVGEAVPFGASPAYYFD